MQGPFEIPDSLRQRLTASGISLPDSAWRGKGCSHCRDTGYWGRIAVFELMTITPEMANLISANVPTAALQTQAHQDGMISMLEDGIEKVGQGITTLEEVLRIAVLEDVSDIQLPVIQPAQEKPAVKVEKEAEISEKASLDLDDYKKKMMHWLARKT